jgi:cell division protein FtsX
MSIFSTLILLALSRSRHLHSGAAIGIAGFLAILWIIQISLWFTCEISDSHIKSWCPVQNGTLVVGRAKAYMGIFVALGFIGVMFVASWRMTKRKSEHVEHAEDVPEKPVKPESP